MSDDAVDTGFLAQELELFRTGFGSFVALDKAFSEMGVAMEMARHTQS